MELKGTNSDTDIEVTCWEMDSTVALSNTGSTITLGMEDFLIVAMHALTSTNLEKDDPRIDFLEKVSKLTKVKGSRTAWNRTATNERLGFPQKKPAKRRKIARV